MATTLPYTPPLQALPSWLSYSTFQITTGSDPATVVITQSVVNLPLTYYGPPIPLGTDGVWVYGGLTSPAPTSTTASSSASTTSLSASQTSTQPQSTTTSTASSSQPITTTSPPSTSSSLPPTSTSSSSSSPSTVSNARSGSHFPTWAIALISSVVGVALIVALLLCIGFAYRRRNERAAGTRRSMSFAGFKFTPVSISGARRSSHTVIPSDEAAGPSAPRAPAHVDAEHEDDDWEVMPRPTPTPTEQMGIAYRAIAPDDGPSGSPERATHTSSSGAPRPSQSDSNRSLFFNPADADAPHPSLLAQFPEVPTTPVPIPLMPPPALRNNSGGVRTVASPEPPMQSPPPLSGATERYLDSPMSETDEGAALLTAQRVTVPARTGLGSLVRLSSLWLKRLSGSTNPDTDPEQGRPRTATPNMSGPSPLGLGLLGVPALTGSSVSLGVPRRGPLLGSERPLSLVSAATSGATQWHDARSRPATPYSDTPPSYGDVLDAPVPQPFRLRGAGASPQSLPPGAASPRLPPGLGYTPTRVSYVDVDVDAAMGEADAAAAGLDVLEEEPPAAYGPLKTPPRGHVQSPSFDSKHSHSDRSRSTGKQSGSLSSASRMSRQSRSGSSLAVSVSVDHRAGGGGDPYRIGETEMPTAAARRKGKSKRGERENPLLSGTFGTPATWLPRSRSASRSRPTTPAAAASRKSGSGSNGGRGSTSVPTSPTRAFFPGTPVKATFHPGEPTFHPGDVGLGLGLADVDEVTSFSGSASVLSTHSRPTIATAPTEVEASVRLLKSARSDL